MAVSFNEDILPIFYKWKAQMAWRLDLSKYEDVKMNAPVIYNQIANGPMPPPPYPPLSQDQINLFKQWMDEGCQP